MQRRTLLASLAASALPASTARATSGFMTTADNRRLAYLDRGRGAPVVFIHGWSLGSAIWSLQTDWLAERGLRAVAYDRRGHAGSDKPADGYDFDTLAADLAAVLDQLDLNDVTLVGHSMGAGEVARYLARHDRKRIARTLLVAPTTPFSLKTADNPDGIDRAVYDKIVATLEADPPAYLAAGAPGFFGRGAEPEMVEWGLSIARQASVPALVKCLRAFSETDFRADMRAFTMPTLIVYGTGDVPSMAKNAARTAALIAGSRVASYEGAPHGLFLTDPARFNRDLLEFIRS
ncbi:MAG TPA: alpha/beta hydrolase [Reyranella sp.]|nr:alpha/beta hydrolase [Reyranella sp.]